MQGNCKHKKSEAVCPSTKCPCVFQWWDAVTQRIIQYVVIILKNAADNHSSRRSGVWPVYTRNVPICYVAKNARL